VIDLPPEQVIEQRLEDCGLDSKGISVKYEGNFQSIEVVIKPEAGAASQHFQCIHEAAGYEIVTFPDMEMARQYSDFTTELIRPKMLEDARKSLETMGLLENFPARANFGSDKLFAEAIEVHCALDAGSAITSYGESLAFEPPQEGLKDFDAFQEKYSCLFTAMTFAMAKRDVQSFGFVGNEADVPAEEQR
jgi:hypothetical protein